MDANKHRALARVVYFTDRIERAREKNEPTSYLEEQLLSALILADLNCRL